MITLDQVEAKINSIENKIKGIIVRLDKYDVDLSGKTNIADLNRSIEELRELIRDNSSLITQLEDRLSKVILPEETRYYLDQGEVSTFQSNFQSLKAMMNKFDKLYKNLIAYRSNLDS